MNNIYLKSILYGTILGGLLFTIAPLGLGIPFIEVLKPFLAPGAMVAQIVVPNSAGMSAVLFALVVNAAIYSLLFIVYFSIRKNAN